MYTRTQEETNLYKLIHHIGTQTGNNYVGCTNRDQVVWLTMMSY